MKYECPNCEEHCISAYQKLCVSPMVSQRCPNCKLEFTVKWRHYLWALASIGVVIYLVNHFQLEDIPKLIVCVAAVIVISALQLKFAPLSTRDSR